MKSYDFSSEEKNILEVIRAARTIQEFLWGDFDKEAGLEEFKRMFRKRVVKLDEIEMSNPHWRIEFKKRLIQTAAIAISAITKIDQGFLTFEGTHPKQLSSVPEYADPIKEK